MKSNVFIIFLILFTSSFRTFSQDSIRIYENAFLSLESMLSGKSSICFKKAVYITENAYLNDRLSYNWFNDEIQTLKNISLLIVQKQQLNYNEKDKDLVNKYSAIYRTLKDTLAIQIDSVNFIYHLPYTYDFEDIWASHDLTKMFVSKLLNTGKGNCHSLPFLYKIIAEELNVPAYLALAPSHIYLKQYCEKTGWFNTELTNGTFPIDAWIVASGYIPVEAIQNGLYMDTMSMQQSIAFCMIDLAKGYERKFGVDNPDFILKCINTSLKYYPNCIIGLLVKAETEKKIIEHQMKLKNVKKPEELFSDFSIKQMYDEMEQTYIKIYQLGYRQMPEEMYIKWMKKLENERNKYQNVK